MAIPLIGSGVMSFRVHHPTQRDQIREPSSCVKGSGIVEMRRRRAQASSTFRRMDSHAAVGVRRWANVAGGS